MNYYNDNNIDNEIEDADSRIVTSLFCKKVKNFLTFHLTIIVIVCINIYYIRESPCNIAPVPAICDHFAETWNFALAGPQIRILLKYQFDIYKFSTVSRRPIRFNFIKISNFKELLYEKSFRTLLKLGGGFPQSQFWVSRLLLIPEISTFTCISYSYRYEFTEVQVAVVHMHHMNLSVKTCVFQIHIHIYLYTIMNRTWEISHCSYITTPW